MTLARLWRWLFAGALGRALRLRSRRWLAVVVGLVAARAMERLSRRREPKPQAGD